MIPSHIFREYDIRGEVDKDLTEPVVQWVGQAYGTYILGRLGSRPSGKKPTVTVGRDVRLHSERMKEALAAGLRASGLSVIDIGVCPTPLTYFSIHHLSPPFCTEIPPTLKGFGDFEIVGGIMVTGSHNPPEFNGFKMCEGKAALYGEQIQEIGRIAKELSAGGGPKPQAGEIVEYDIITPYRRYLRDQFVNAEGKKAVPPNKIKVVVDSGNGTAGVIAPGILREMGCDVTDLFSEPDGRFPNHHPDPTILKNLADLIAAVREKGAHAGIAYDGDADRIGVVDERGEVIWGDRLMVIYARDILKDHPGGVVISEVKASQVLYDDIAHSGGRGIMWKAGHSLIKAKMKETHAVLGGEVSGHVFFADRFFGYDDAIYATCRLVEILQRTEVAAGFSLRPSAAGEKQWGVSALLKDLPETVVTPEIRVNCADDRKFGVVDRLKEKIGGEQHAPKADTPPIRDLVTVDGIRVIFDRGWGLVRPSNTQPVLVLRFEADDELALRIYQGYVESRLKELIGGLETAGH